MTALPPNSLRQLRLAIVQSFDLDDLQTIAFDLQVDWDELNGPTKSTKTQALLSELSQQRRLPELLDILIEERPHVGWPRILPDIHLPFDLGTSEFMVNEVEQRAAWSLYVELATRAATQPFNEESGQMRSVLSSLYAVFGFTRSILREAGPEVAHGPGSFGVLAIDVLTKGIGPFTTKWHHPLEVYEKTRDPAVDALEHERNWEHYATMKEELLALQEQMRVYASVLAEIAGADISN